MKLKMVNFSFFFFPTLQSLILEFTPYFNTSRSKERLKTKPLKYESFPKITKTTQKMISWNQE